MAPPTLGDWAATAGALFTAAAAGAAYLAARQGRESLDAAERPLLEVQVLADHETGTLMLSIINSARGVARGANFAVHAVGYLTDGVIGDGFVESGAKVHIVTDIGPLPTPEGKMRNDVDDLAVMVVFRDARGFAHYRTHTGRQYTPRTLMRRRPKYPDRVAVFKKLYPDIDVDSATRASSQVIKG